MPKALSEFHPISGWRLFYKERPTILYYVCFTFKKQKYYKIGITTKGIKERFRSEPVPYKVIWSKQYDSGLPAYKEEQRILKANKKFQYYGPNILRSGNLELFTKNIMKE